MGLSIGVHLLNLLTIPAIVVIYFYKRYDKNSKWRTFLGIVIGCLITGLAVIQWTIGRSRQLRHILCEYP